MVSESLTPNQLHFRCIFWRNVRSGRRTRSNVFFPTTKRRVTSRFLYRDQLFYGVLVVLSGRVARYGDGFRNAHSLLIGDRRKFCEKNKNFGKKAFQCCAVKTDSMVKPTLSFTVNSPDVRFSEKSHRACFSAKVLRRLVSESSSLYFFTGRKDQIYCCMKSEFFDALVCIQAKISTVHTVYVACFHQNEILTWASEGIFPGAAKKIFQRSESGEISFYLLETKNQPFFAKNLIGKCQISKSRGSKVPPALPFRRPWMLVMYPAIINVYGKKAFFRFIVRIALSSFQLYFVSISRKLDWKMTLVWKEYVENFAKYNELLSFYVNILLCQRTVKSTLWAQSKWLKIRLLVTQIKGHVNRIMKKDESYKN